MKGYKQKEKMKPDMKRRKILKMQACLFMLQKEKERKKRKDRKRR